MKRKNTCRAKNKNEIIALKAIKQPEPDRQPTESGANVAFISHFSFFSAKNVCFVHAFFNRLLFFTLSPHTRIEWNKNFYSVASSFIAQNELGIRCHSPSSVMTCNHVCMASHPCAVPRWSLVETYTQLVVFAVDRVFGVPSTCIMSMTLITIIIIYNQKHSCSFFIRRFSCCCTQFCFVIVFSDEKIRASWDEWAHRRGRTQSSRMIICIFIYFFYVLSRREMKTSSKLDFIL